MRARHRGTLLVLGLLAGCAGADVGGSGWRFFDSAFDGLENAQLVGTTGADEFDVVFDGVSPFGHKAYYESPLREGESLRLAFRAEVALQVTLTLEHLHEYRCDEGEGWNRTVNDAVLAGYVVRDAGVCTFHLRLLRDVVAENGVHLVWEATTIAFDGRDEGPGGGAPLRFEASRTTEPSIQNS